MKFLIKTRTAFLSLLALAAMPLFANTNLGKPPKPNNLLILCDDLGYSDVGFNGSPDIITPELDKLAKNGTKFSSAYVVHPFCGPSRAALITGRYSHKIGAQYNLPDFNYNMEDGIPVEETFMSDVIKTGGYYTSALGKWHLGYGPQFHPNKRGFDDFYGFLGGGHEYFPAQYMPKYEVQVKNGNKKPFAYITPLDNNGKPAVETEYVTDALSREAIKNIKKAADLKKPFFMYLAYNAPHSPMEAKEEDLKIFENIADPKRRTYAAMVYAVDRGVGEIVKKLKETKQFDNTLIVFLSDNGGDLKYGATNYPLKGAKGDIYEGGYRVPMFFHWPNVVPAGKTFVYAISALDFFPTFAGLAGAKIPDSKKLDGRDIWADFLAGKSLHKDEMIYAARYRSGFSDFAARKEDLKIVKAGTAKWKVFDVRNDPGETKDLSAKYATELSKMEAEAELWTKSHVKPLWFDNKKVEEMWNETNMPNYDKAFKSAD